MLFNGKNNSKLFIRKDNIFNKNGEHTKLPIRCGGFDFANIVFHGKREPLQFQLTQYIENPVQIIKNIIPLLGREDTISDNIIDGDVKHMCNGKFDFIGYLPRACFILRERIAGYAQLFGEFGLCNIIAFAKFFYGIHRENITHNQNFGKYINQRSCQSQIEII